LKRRVVVGCIVGASIISALAIGIPLKKRFSLSSWSNHPHPPSTTSKSSPQFWQNRPFQSSLSTLKHTLLKFQEEPKSLQQELCRSPSCFDQELAAVIEVLERDEEEWTQQDYRTCLTHLRHALSSREYKSFTAQQRWLSSVIEMPVPNAAKMALVQRLAMS